MALSAHMPLKFSDFSVPKVSKYLVGCKVIFGDTSSRLRRKPIAASLIKIGYVCKIGEPYVVLISRIVRFHWFIISNMSSFLRFVHLRDHPGILRADQFVELSPGINILYGLNGSGKTSFLRRVASAIIHWDADEVSSIDLKSILSMSRGLDLFLEMGEGLSTSTRYDDVQELIKPLYHSTFNRTFGPGPCNLEQVKWDYLEGVIGFPIRSDSDNYYLTQELDEESISEDAVLKWTEGKPLLKYSLNEDEDNYYEISLIHRINLLTNFQKEEWEKIKYRLDLIKDSLLELWNQDNFEEYRHHLNKHFFDHIWNQETQNLLINSNNFGFGKLGIFYITDFYNATEHYISLPSLGFSKSSGIWAIFEKSLFNEKLERTNDSEEEINVSTLNNIFRAGDSHMDRLAREEKLQANANEITESANLIFSKLMLDAPRLVFMQSIHQLPEVGPSFSWYFSIDGKENSWHSLSELSLAQRRWAEISINLAFLQRESIWIRKPILIIDEPEASIHITGQRHLLQGLVWLQNEYDLQILIASHSPLFLEISNAKIFELKKEDSGSLLRDLPKDLRSELSSLGIEPVDLLRGVNYFLIVEGQHEIDIINTLFSTEFAQMKIHLLPLRGAKNLTSIVNSSFIFEFSNAKVVVMLDNLEKENVSRVWSDSRNMLAEEKLEDIKKYILDNLPANERIEYKFLREFMVRAIEVGLDDRVNFFSMSKQDIIEYLPCESFVRNENWDTLRNKWNESKTKLDFKSWITKTYNFTFDSNKIKESVEEMDIIHEDLTDLLNFFGENKIK